jgi:hypothetical protein
MQDEIADEVIRELYYGVQMNPPLEDGEDGTVESPSKYVKKISNIQIKEYRGMAKLDATQEWFS